MTLTQSGPRCDVCGSYILLDKSINPFQVRGIEQELHCHDKWLNDADGFAEVIAMVHPENAPIVRAALEMYELLKTLVAAKSLCDGKINFHITEMEKVDALLSKIEGN